MSLDRSRRWGTPTTRNGQDVGRKVWVGKCGPVDAAEHLEVVSHPISRVWLDCSSSQPLGGRWRSSTIVRSPLPEAHGNGFQKKKKKKNDSTVAWARLRGYQGCGRRVADGLASVLHWCSGVTENEDERPLWYPMGHSGTSVARPPWYATASWEIVLFVWVFYQLKGACPTDTNCTHQSPRNTDPAYINIAATEQFRTVAHGWDSPRLWLKFFEQTMVTCHSAPQDIQ